MRKFLRSTTFVFLAALIASAGVATAQPYDGTGPGRGMGRGMGMGMGNPDAPWRLRFTAIDTDGNGVVSPAEARANAVDVFAAMDADGNGRLTREEYMAVRMGPQRGLNPARMNARQAAKAARFAPMDVDADGTVDAAEFVNGAESRMRAADRNGDGVVSPIEFRGRGW